MSHRMSVMLSANMLNIKTIARIRGAIDTEFARKCFFYIGTTTFNELPLTAKMPDIVFAWRKVLNNTYV